MSTGILSKAENFYVAMKEKKLEAVAKYLHPEVKFSSPYRRTEGQADYLKAVKDFMERFNTLSIRALFEAKEQAMVVYDIEFPPPIGKLPTAGFLTFNKEGLIVNIELFFDTGPLN